MDVSASVAHLPTPADVSTISARSTARVAGVAARHRGRTSACLPPSLLSTTSAWPIPVALPTHLRIIYTSRIRVQEPIDGPHERRRGRVPRGMALAALPVVGKGGEDVPPLV